MSALRAERALDADLLSALHEQHARALWGFVVRLLDGDHARAQDVVQETFLRAWRNPKVLAASAGSVRGWLFTVARRIVIDEWRGSERHPEFVTADVPEEATLDAAEQVLDRHVLMGALRTLSQEHRAVLLECYFRGSSTTEAATRLGVPPGTVKSRTHYALHALREAIDARGGPS